MQTNSLITETAETFDLGDRKVGERLDCMIDESGLDPEWVMEHIEDYHIGNEHIGQWQRYVQSGRWEELAAKLTRDKEQLEKMNKTMDWSKGRRCKIMSSIHSTGRLFFRRLNGVEDFDLSEKALRMEDGYGSSSSSSSVGSAR